MAGPIRRKQAKAVAETAVAEPWDDAARGEAAPKETSGPGARSAGSRIARALFVGALGLALVAFLAWRPALAPAVVGYGLIALTLYGVLRLFVRRPRREAAAAEAKLPDDPSLPLPEVPFHPSALALPPQQAVGAVTAPPVDTEAEAEDEASAASDETAAPAAVEPRAGAAPGDVPLEAAAAPALDAPQEATAAPAAVMPVRAGSKPGRDTSRLTSEEAVARLPVSLRQWMEARGATIPPERPAARWTSPETAVAPVERDCETDGRPGVTFARMLSRRRAELKTAGGEPAGFSPGEAG